MPVPVAVASILVPTHNHASTLALAVGSALGQTVSEVEVLIIGDGVTHDVRSAAGKLVAADSRVRFLDYRKGANHGESYRDLAIREATSDAIFYLCDDDLLMRHYVADLLGLLEGHNFVQSRNGYFRVDGTVVPYPGDLADQRMLAAALGGELQYNFVSVTGTAHSRQFYFDVNDPWAPTPAGIPPDLHQWRKMWRSPHYSGATSDRMTALQFPTSSEGRDRWSAKRRLAELREWAEIAASDSGQEEVDRLVARGDMRMLMDNYLYIWEQRDGIAHLQRIIESAEGPTRRRGVRRAARTPR